jgi:hypothetical protein
MRVTQCLPAGQSPSGQRTVAAVVEKNERRTGFKDHPWCEKSIDGIPQVFYPYVELAAANAWAGHDREAKDVAAQLQKVLPGYTVQTWAGRHVSDDPTYKAQYQRIVEGLRKTD